MEDDYDDIEDDLYKGLDKDDWDDKEDELDEDNENNEDIDNGNDEI